MPDPPVGGANLLDDASFESDDPLTRDTGWYVLDFESDTAVDRTTEHAHSGPADPCEHVPLKFRAHCEAAAAGKSPCAGKTGNELEKCFITTSPPGGPAAHCSWQPPDQRSLCVMEAARKHCSKMGTLSRACFDAEMQRELGGESGLSDQAVSAAAGAAHRNSRGTEPRVSGDPAAAHVDLVEPSRASMGQIVTLLGWNFGAAANHVVYFAGHGVNIVLQPVTWSDQAVTLRIPDDWRIAKGVYYHFQIETREPHAFSNKESIKIDNTGARPGLGEMSICQALSPNRRAQCYAVSRAFVACSGKRTAQETDACLQKVVAAELRKKME